MPKLPDSQQTWWSERPSEASREPVVVADRWVLGTLLGRGGFGRVVAAEDRVTGVSVAVKIIDRVSSGVRLRLSRELTALRRLDHPGVVRFLADRPLGEGHCIVMERLPEETFPGDAARDWALLRPVVLALFRALAHIHEHQIIHRDLKPSNVLMRGSQPVLLDFGLARGPELGATITRSGARLGTLRYMSPEQGAGERVTLKTDLYSAGLMVYEALTGRMPHPGQSGEVLLRGRLTRIPRPIRDHRPDLPVEVATTIDALLSRDPAERPSDAQAVLALMDGVGAPELPWLGDTTLLERTIERLDQGESLSIAGPEGSGRSRLLQEVAARRPHHWLRPGTRPYESLGDLIGVVDLSSARSGAEAREKVQRALGERVADGTILLVDEVALDWSTQQLLDGHTGPVLRVSPSALPPSGVTISLSCLSQASLRPLFDGPDRVLHLREDAAAELHRRTHGHPAQVVRELAAWQRAGLASSTQDGLLVERSMLDRLRAEEPPRSRATAPEGTSVVLPARLERVLHAVQVAGRHATPAVLGALTELSGWQLDEALHELEARGLVNSEAGWVALVNVGSSPGWTPEERVELHARLAVALPKGADDRLHYMLEGEVRDGLVDEALSACRILERAGRVADARAWLERVSRSAVDEEALRPVLEAHVRLALDAADASVALAAAELVRQSPLAAGEGLLGVAAAIEALERDEAGRAQEILGELPPFEDRHLEAQRIRHLQMRAERLVTGSDLSILQAAMAEDWPSPWPEVWAALLAYRKSDLRAAAGALEAAAEAEERTAHRVRDRLRAASAWSMVGELDRTLALAQTGLLEAQQRRLSGLELHAEWTQRMVAQKRGATQVDWELVRAAERLSKTTDDAGFVVLTESYIAFQGDDHPAMLTLARKALRALKVRGLADGAQMAAGLVAAGEARWDDLRAMCVGGSPVARADLLSLLAHFGVATAADQQQLRSVAQSLSEAGLSKVGLFNLANLQ